MPKIWILYVGLAVLLYGCDFKDHRTYHDPALKLRQEDYKKITTPPPLEKEPPQFCPKLPCPQKAPLLTPEMQKKISLSLHENIPLKSVFMELGRQAGVGIVLSPKVPTQMIGLVYEAHNETFITVIEDLCSLINHRFQVMGNRLLIEPDDPYLKTYMLQFLNHSRNSENKIAISTDLFAPMEGQNRLDNGSMSILSGKSSMDFWKELEQNIKMLLFSEDLPQQQSSYYSLHKQGGLLTIFATARQHHHISDYLKKLKESTATQVLIEAKIIEVTLDDEYKTGINWSHLGDEIKVGVPLGSLTSLSGISPAQPLPLFLYFLNRP